MEKIVLSLKTFKAIIA